MHWFQWLDTPLKELAIVVGAVWVVLNYVLGRTHKSRIQLRVFADRASRKGEEFLILRTELNNVGLSKVELKHEGCALTIFIQRPFEQTGKIWELGWRELETLKLYLHQDYVEPSGVLIDAHAVLLPRLMDNFYKVQARFESTTVVLRSVVIVPPMDMTGLKNANMGEGAKIKGPA